ncbi:hypothetical protein GCM10023115_19270 [Pontixanthobacter gangjinensis]|uniref:Uncharacterized protein n=1 Tax=Pontixanthobacter gangjinensis TaxID=1028742 RepID=A0A6I4SQ31_9SPHN|nr:hypothetical protein [Pontixanthobacter gangjinensis]MXO57176.1 hypothetical protein [Pontixanthobacter gangjinensis]
MQNDQLSEARQVNNQTHAWLDSLLTSGVSEAAAVTGMMNALVERALVNGGTPKTAKWLRGQARQIEKNGDALIEAFAAHKGGG